MTPQEQRWTRDQCIILALSVALALLGGCSMTDGVLGKWLDKNCPSVIKVSQ